VLLEPLLIVSAPPDIEEDAHDVQEDEQVEHADDPEERAGDTRPDRAAVNLEARDRRVDGRGGEGETRCERKHDREVAQREEEADSKRTLSVAEELPGCVVGDTGVVGVERMPQPNVYATVPSPASAGVALEE
jgi:hypothetical protein